MATITAATVKELRERTGLPMMECKRALQETDGDVGGAEELLRKRGKKTMETRAGRDTAFGRLAIYTDMEQGVGAMIELRCESAPVATSEEFANFAKDLAKQLATGPGAQTPEELMKQASPSEPGKTLEEVKDDMTNRIREVFKFTRLVRIDGTCGGYAHHTGSPAVLAEVEGGTPELAKQVCMHIAAQAPQVVSKEDLDPAAVEKEREILSEAARKEGKPENIIAKMVEGRLRTFYEAKVLNEQPFVLDDKLTVGKFAAQNKMKILRFVRWTLDAS